MDQPLHGGEGQQKAAAGAFRLLKVQTPALSLPRPLWRRRRGRPWRFGAHTFVAVQDGAGRIVRELHGIARGAGGAQLPTLGGVTPFRRELIWGEDFPHRTGFYDGAHPQGPLWNGSAEALAALLARAARVRAAVNAASLPYAWPAFAGRNSNGYYSTLLAGMDLPDVRLDGQLWAPGAARLLLPPEVLAEIRA